MSISANICVNITPWPLATAHEEAFAPPLRNEFKMQFAVSGCLSYAEWLRSWRHYVDDESWRHYVNKESSRGKIMYCGKSEVAKKT